jgi:hypothetical protein
MSHDDFEFVFFSCSVLFFFWYWGTVKIFPKGFFDAWMMMIGYLNDFIGHGTAGDGVAWSMIRDKADTRQKHIRKPSDEHPLF